MRHYDSKKRTELSLGPHIYPPLLKRSVNHTLLCRLYVRIYLRYAAVYTVLPNFDIEV